MRKLGEDYALPSGLTLAGVNVLFESISKLEKHIADVPLPKGARDCCLLFVVPLHAPFSQRVGHLLANHRISCLIFPYPLISLSLTHTQARD